LDRKLYLGDCVNVLYNEVEDSSIDMTVTSPPYDNLRDYGGHDTPDIDKAIEQLYRVTKQGGVVVWIIADQVKNGSESGTSFKQALKFMDAGFRLHDTMIWLKDTSAFPERVRYSQVFEYMFVFSKGKPKTFNPIKDRPNKYAGTNIHGTYRNKDGSVTKRNEEWNKTVVNEYGNRFNVWKNPTEKKNKTGHPAVFPLKLVKDHIISWSNEGDIILDPFMGSGTTGVASKELNREFTGIEIDKNYFNIAEERVNNTK